MARIVTLITRSLNIIPNKLSYQQTRTATTIIRKPIRVLTDDGKDYDDFYGSQGKMTKPDEYHDEDDELIVSEKKKPTKNPDRQNRAIAKKQFYLKNRDDIIKRDTEFIKTITGINRQKSKSDLIILEGRRLIDDAAAAQANIKKLYYGYKKSLKQLQCLQQLEAAKTEITEISSKEIENFSQVVTSSGLIAIAEKPTPEQIINSSVYQSEQNRIPTTLVLNNVSDPGNMGTIIRTAAAVGLSRIYCSPKCVNIWDTKVLRSSMGAHFRIPVLNSLSWSELVQRLVEESSSLFYAKQPSDGEVVANYSDVKFFDGDRSENGHITLLIGGEAHGYSEEAKELIEKLNGQPVSIPLAYQTESLNSAIASAVIMYEIKRQLTVTAKI